MLQERIGNLPFIVGLAAALTAASAGAEPSGIQLSKDKLSLVLDPAYGGRITELRYGEKDLLSLARPSGNNFGSTFWLSPQSLWQWPPVPEHDHQPYSVITQGDDSASLASAPGAGAKVYKTVSVESDQRIAVHYRIDAEQDFPEVAAWEITRVPKRGLAFAPVNADTVKTVRGEVAYTLDKDTLWLPLNEDAPLVEGKVIANGSEGWLAYVVDQLLYLKVYPPVAAADMATGEGDIELYLSGESPYLELEVQSAAHQLRQEEALSWTVNWLVVPVPEALAVHTGSPALLDFVRNQVRAFSHN
ncbi:DUF4380 domain-containing protein [Microbulbifer elongatus]|uniref:DUF4380 domain-containing protein n=1 Tax=Microbulbifer elongatus TaxID=86173 RepID=UPI001E3665DF|nr:DUF4380 domain-containing protein [Microbulbifer elongatus]